ncbi:MAG TPA: class I SAM-dependent methyltransferase, partial [Gaiellaceae bacterium]|nr:class I SAM-dependent methyltransferase [Gaiellaceae bacterium]
MTEYYRHYWSEQGYNPRRFGTPDDLRKLYEVYATSETDCVDIGCGDGGTSGLLLDQRANSYVGVDLSPTAVELATGRGLDARVIEDAAKLPFGDDSFDLAVCIEVLEHMYEPHLAVREVMRVLRPGGRLIATVPNAAHWRDRVDMLLGIWQPRGDDRGRSEPWRSPHVRFFRPATLER